MFQNFGKRDNEIRSTTEESAKSNYSTRNPIYSEIQLRITVQGITTEESAKSKTTLNYLLCCWEQREYAGSRYQKLCCGLLHRSIHRSHRHQSAVTCSADREPPSWSRPSASQVSYSFKPSKHHILVFKKYVQRYVCTSYFRRSE